MLRYRLRYLEGDDDAPSNDPPPADPPKTFTQEEVDNIVKSRLDRAKKETDKHKAEYERLLTSQNLTKEERDRLQVRIDELENETLTEKQRIAKEQQKLEAQYTKNLKLAEDERETWKTRYQETVIERALTDAAVAAGAENPTQLRMMFRGSAKLVENDGVFTPTLQFVGLGEDGKTEEVMELPVDKAMEKIKADGKNKNLFRHGGTPGTGNPTGGHIGRSADERPSPDQYPDHASFSQAYQEWRDTHNADGSKR